MDVLGVTLRAQIALLHLGNPVVHGLQANAPAAGAHVQPVGDAGDLLQSRLVQARLHDLALGILQIIHAVAIAQGNQLALCRAHAHGKNPHASFSGGPCSGDGIIRVILAIGNQNQRLVLALGCPKSPNGRANGLGNRCALFRDEAHIGLSQKHLGRGVIQRERAEHMAIPGKCHQPDAVAFEAVDQPLNFKSRTVESVGLDILGQHAQGRIQHDHQIHALAVNHLQLRAELRLYQRQHQKRKPHAHQRGLDPLPNPAHARREFVHQRGRAKCVQCLPLAPKRPPVKQREHRHPDQKIKRL